MTRSSEASPAAGLIDRAALAFEGYRAGERERMGELVDLLTPILWHTARTQGADARRAEDAVQTAWLRLVDHASGIEDPRRVLAWLMTTVRREARRAVERARRDDRPLEEAPEPPSVEPGPEQRTVLGERQQVLWQHVAALPERCRHLLRVVAFAERPDYAAVARTLGMPIGSIGPTRGRCLDKLRRSLTADVRWEMPHG